MNTSFQRFETSTPYWDTRLSWYKNAWFYRSLRGIYTNDPIATQHPEWILKDAHGNSLYVAFGCTGGTCPAYAANTSNAAYRQYWITRATSDLAIGYLGIWIDNVDLTMEISDGNGNLVAPVDPNTGTTMTLSNWEKYEADFTQAIRAAFPPSVELVHNAIWTAGINGVTDPYVQEEISAATIVNLQRGMGDPGATGGTGPYSLYALFNYVDTVHQLGRAVLFEEELAENDYDLAGYFMISNGNDYEDNDTVTPDPGNFYIGFSANLGTPLGNRYYWTGLWRRDFTNGVALVNNPTLSGTVTATPQGSFVDVNGNAVTSVTLAPGQGKVLIGVPTFTQPPQPFGIEAGGSKPVGYFQADNSSVGGHTVNLSSKTVITAGVLNAAPAYVYEDKRASNDAVTPFSYVIQKLIPGTKYTVRLHFADDNSYSVGHRLFNVVLNGVQVLTNFDIYAASGQVVFKAVVEQFTTTVPASGNMTVQFNPVVYNCMVNGLEFIPQ